jgi:AcrR family transcriptional regulator
VPDSEPTPSRAEQRRRTEARILAAATQLFVERGYERTTIRAIAEAAGVDGGLVMHYFESKDQLFQRVTHPPTTQDFSGTAEEVTEQILDRLAESLTSEPVQSLALLRSMLTHPEAADVLREGAAEYQAQISRPIQADDADLRAALVSSVWLGVVVSRHLLKYDALSDASPQDVIKLLRPCLRFLTRADVPAKES